MTNVVVSDALAWIRKDSLPIRLMCLDETIKKLANFFAVEGPRQAAVAAIQNACGWHVSDEWASPQEPPHLSIGNCCFGSRAARPQKMPE